MRPAHLIGAANIIAASEAARAERVAQARADAAFAAALAAHPPGQPRDPCLRCGTTGRDHAAFGCRRDDFAC